MSERYVHLVLAGSEPPADGRLPGRARWYCASEPAARDTARRLTDRRVDVLSALDDPTRAAAGVRDVLRTQTGDLVLVGPAPGVAAVAADLTGDDVAPAFADVVTVRLESPTPSAPLTLPIVLVAALVLSLVDVGQWLVTGRPGLVVGPALVVAGLVAAPRQSRDVGVSLVAAVLLASFLDLGWLNFIPRLRG